LPDLSCRQAVTKEIPSDLRCLLFLLCIISSYLKGDNKAGARRAAPATPAASNRDDDADLCAAVRHCEREPHVSLVAAEAGREHGRGDGAV